MRIRRKKLGCYEKHIIEVVHCSDAEATVVEEIMRRDIFHSTLDWQTAAEFEGAAREAYAALKEMWSARTLPESYRRILEQNSTSAH